MRVIKKLSSWYDELQRLFPGREDVIDMALCCLIARQNLLLIGNPGYGKTKVLDAIVDSIVPAKVFHYQFHKASRREEVVGMVNAPHYIETGEVKTNVKSFLPDAHYAVLDEFLRSNPATANTILSVIHPFEHLFKNGNEIIHCPMKACFATANYMNIEDAEEMEAIYERFAVTMHLSTTMSSEDELAVYQTYREPFNEVIPDKLLDELHAQQKRVIVDNEKLLYLRKARLAADTVRHVSPRTACFALEIAKAYAAVQGEKLLTTGHLDHVIPHVFSREAKDLSQIISIMVSLC